MNKLKRLKNDTKGFTLMELIIVIVIIGVLVAILVPNMASWIGKSKKTAFKDEANNIKQTISAELVEEYAAGNVITNSNDLDWAEINKKFGKSNDGEDNLKNHVTFTTDTEEKNNNLKTFEYFNDDFKITYDEKGWSKVETK